jgi:hypothetical protein
MRFDPERNKYVVRWREDGSRRVARLDTAEEAEALEQRRDGATARGDAQCSHAHTTKTRP